MQIAHSTHQFANTDHPGLEIKSKLPIRPPIGGHPNPSKPPTQGYLIMALNQFNPNHQPKQPKPIASAPWNFDLLFGTFPLELEPRTAEIRGSRSRGSRHPPAEPRHPSPPPARRLAAARSRGSPAARPPGPRSRSGASRTPATPRGPLPRARLPREPRTDAARGCFCQSAENEPKKAKTTEKKNSAKSEEHEPSEQTQ